MTKFLLLLTTILSGTPKTLEAEEFLLRWEHEEDKVNFSLFAPTDGWVAIGFTENEDIVDSNLIMVRVEDHKAYGEDQYIVGFGKHPEVTSLGVPSRISDVSGHENSDGTTISFSITKQQMDSYHFDLSEGNEINVWLAWSVSDDFDHHSRKRILRRIEL